MPFVPASPAAVSLSTAVFAESPFFTVVKNITPGQRLERGTTTVSFIIDPDDAAKLREPDQRYQVRLFCGRFDLINTRTRTPLEYPRPTVLVVESTPISMVRFCMKKARGGREKTRGALGAKTRGAWARKGTGREDTKMPGQVV